MNCPIRLVRAVGRGTLDLATGATTALVFKYERNVCDAPLFGRDRIVGICSGCAKHGASRAGLYHARYEGDVFRMTLIAEDEAARLCALPEYSGE